MSANAVAGASGCCCAPAPTPCLCLEYQTASIGPLFERLTVSGMISMTWRGTDCCGAKLNGSALFGGARISRTPSPLNGWNITKDQVCPFLSIGEVIGSVESTVGRCSYMYPCCTYTGCPAVERRVIDSALPLWWCDDTYALAPQDPCMNITCSCDQGGIPCGGTCPPTTFPEYATASPERLLVAVDNVYLTVCGVNNIPGAAGAQAKSYLQIEVRDITERNYRTCDGCGASFQAVPLSRTFWYEKLCRYPGDSVKGLYVWIDAWNGGPPSQVVSVTEACQPDIEPGGQRQFVATFIASPTMVVN